jgi:hypothetical protein
MKSSSRSVLGGRSEARIGERQFDESSSRANSVYRNSLAIIANLSSSVSQKIDRNMTAHPPANRLHGNVDDFADEESQAAHARVTDEYSGALADAFCRWETDDGFRRVEILISRG